MTIFGPDFPSSKCSVHPGHTCAPLAPDRLGHRMLHRILCLPFSDLWWPSGIVPPAPMTIRVSRRHNLPDFQPMPAPVAGGPLWLFTLPHRASAPSGPWMLTRRYLPPVLLANDA